MSSGSVNVPPGPTWSYDTVRGRLTDERLGPYLAASGKNLSQAFRLYEWNIAASASVLTTLAMVEVVVRNAIDTELRRWARTRHGGQSWMDVAPLSDQGRKDVERARKWASRGHRGTPSHGKVLAELNLGFWRYLVVSRHFTELWTPALHAAFPLGPESPDARRVAVDDHLDRLLLIRNRAAHHEPIFRRDLLRDLRSATEVTAMICPDSAAWVTARSSVRRIFAVRPACSEEGG